MPARYELLSHRQGRRFRVRVMSNLCPSLLFAEDEPVNRS